MKKSQEQEVVPTGFNLKVTYRDERTGLITHTDPYTVRYVGEVGSNEKSRLWERPKGSGNLFDKHNNPCGRWVYTEKVVKGKKINEGKYDPSAEHIAFTPPPTQDQKLAQELTAKDVRIAELEREMASIKAEQEKKSAQAKKA